MSGGSRTIVVTGGTGALGRAVVGAFLALGDRVLVPWIARDEADALGRAHATERDADRLVLVQADVGDEEDAARVVEEAGAPEVLVNGVGGFGGGQPVHETGLALWDHLYRMNLRSAVCMARAVVPGMCQRGRGVIVNVASQAALARPAGLAAYTASKAGVIVLTETLQKELGEHGIRVNAVSPTTIDTPANRAAMPDADRSPWTPPGRIADVVRWLASDEAAAVRGAVVPV